MTALDAIRAWLAEYKRKAADPITTLMDIAGNSNVPELRRAVANVVAVVLSLERAGAAQADAIRELRAEVLELRRRVAERGGGGPYR